MKKSIIFKSICVFIISLMITDSLAQTSTRFNDGYLSVFKVYGLYEGTINLTGGVTNASATISNISSTAALNMGMTITGTGIAASSVISTIVDANTITISANATATNLNVALTINGALVNRGTNVAIEEYLGTSANQSAPNFSRIIETGANGLVVSGTATSAGAMTRAENGRYLDYIK